MNSAPTAALVTCSRCRRRATFTADAVCTECRSKDSKPKKTQKPAPEVDR